MSWDAGAKMRPILKGQTWRGLRYRPDGGDFVIRNGEAMFTRGLYGRNSAFRVVAGDRPEFMLFGPGKRGTLRLGVVGKRGSKWLIEADDILARYRAGAMIYEVRDAFIGQGMLRLTVLSMGDVDGLILRAEVEGDADFELAWAFGAVCERSFSRAGDIGTETPSSFMLNPEECARNEFAIDGEHFELIAQIKGRQLRTFGVMPEGCRMHAADAACQQSPAAMLASVGSDRKALAGVRRMMAREAVYMAIEKERKQPRRYSELAEVFQLAEEHRRNIAERIRVETPDEFMNTLGGAMAIAADACWEEPTWLHGAVAWRKRLNGWRAAYMGDALGWHDRARMHFRGYSKSQITSPETGKVCPGEMENLAREAKTRESLLYSSGYIAPDPDGKISMSHYDMNLVYIDALLWHLLWTGDLDFAREMWPVITRHLAWEKRCFDADDDGLYDAYCCIWASDAVQYSGGAVTHSTAYNYRANAMAGRIAKMIGQDGSMYEREAAKTLNAMREKLWLPKKGWFAEYKDAMGEQRVHDSAAIWTIYHTIDSHVPTPFEAYQMLRYVDTEIPHLPVEGDGVPEELAVVSTSNWMPYTWSVNNVAMSEIAHMALAYWQGGRCRQAYRLWKGTVLDLMYMSSCPGNFGQLSWLDAYRGELYSDFSDVVGICSRALVEGLFGIVPDALAGELLIRPGMPAEWGSARFETPDVRFRYERAGEKETFTIGQTLPSAMKLKLRCRARRDSVGQVTVNGMPSHWQMVDGAVGEPVIEIAAQPASEWVVSIEWTGKAPCQPHAEVRLADGQEFSAKFEEAVILDVCDPQKVLTDARRAGSVLCGVVVGEGGHRTLFARLSQGQMKWWHPVAVEVFRRGSLPASAVQYVPEKAEMVDLSSHFNDNAGQIFLNDYLSPRPRTVTLQLPRNGVGNWCKFDIHPEIDDSGLRAAAGGRGWIAGPGGIPLATPEKGKNVVYTSLWDNYPIAVSVRIGGKATHVHLMLTGSTNAMQSRFLNGQVVVGYDDGTESVLDLRNPETWWPIQEDYLVDDYAFRIDGELPWRVRFQTGELYRPQRGQGGQQIPGGCATVLTMGLDPLKRLESLTVRARAIDVVVGLMSATLQRT
jgi:hypothetical protein